MSADDGHQVDLPHGWEDDRIVIQRGLAHLKLANAAPGGAVELSRAEAMEVARSIGMPDDVMEQLFGPEPDDEDDPG